MSRRVTITPQSVPRFAPHVTFRFDQTRECWVVLAPERLLLPDEIAVEVLKCCDGANTTAAIVAELAERYDAPLAEIGGDVTGLLQDLADKGFLQA